MHLKEEIVKNGHQWRRKKVLFHQDNAPFHKSTATMAKHELHFELLLYPPILQIWPSVTPGCLQTLKECSITGAFVKRFGSNQEVISKTEIYFEAKDKSFNKKGIELLEKRWNQSNTLEGDYVDESKSNFV